MKRILLLFIWVVWGSISSSAYAATFNGKVIDVDTREPIEGAVVVAVWHEATATLSGESTRVKDVGECLTDKNGEWKIDGPRAKWGGSITSIYTFLTGSYYTRPPQFIVFKPGYCSWPAGFGIDSCKGKLKPSGNEKLANGETVELSKLTNNRDRLRVLPTPIHKDGDKEFYKKQKTLLRLIDEESRYLGIPEYGILKELEDEK
jgi:hypothetical protein